MMSESATKVSCLLIVILSQAITVTCQNETIPTTNPEGFESTVPPYLGTKPPASQPQPILISTENTITAEISIVGSSEAKFRLKYASSAQASKTSSTTTRATTILTTSQVHRIGTSPAAVHSTGSHTGYSETRVGERLANKKSSTKAPIKTSHPVVTSSPIGELMTSWKPTEEVQQVETTKDEFTPSTSSSVKDVIRSSEALKIEASPLLNKQETTSIVPSSQAKQILFSQTKEETTSSLFTEIEASSHLKQTFSSETKEEITSSKVLKINASLIIKEEERSSQSVKIAMSTSSAIKRTLSSQTTEEMKSSKVLEIEPSPVIKEKETPSLIAKPAASKERESSSKQILSYETQEEMTSSKLVTSPSIETSSLDEKEEISLKTVQAATPIKIEPSSLGLKKMTSLPKTMITSSQLVKTVTSSGGLEPASVKASSNPSKDDHSSQHIEDMATPQPTETITPPQLSTSLISTAVEPLIVRKRSSQQLEDMTSPSRTKLMTSSQLLTSSEVIRSTPVKTSTEPKHLEDMTSLQPKNTMTSSPMSSPWQITEAMSSSQVNKEITLSLSQTSSVENTMTSSLITSIMTSSKSIKDLTSSQTLISTPFKEVNIVISALILSSSQIADLITSSHPMTMKALTSSAAEPADEKKPPTAATTKPLVGEQSTTTTKNLTTPQLPTEKTTTSSEMNISDKKSVAKTKSHPTHPPTRPSEPTHHTKPVHPSDRTHHGEKNTTNKTHGGPHGGPHPGPHSTMGYPDEPPVVDASTKEKDDNSWQISVYVVCALLIGIVSFVIVTVIKSNREMRRANLRKRKRAVVRKDNAVALKMIKTEEPKTNPGTEKKKEEKRLSMHSRADPEESIPLLQLHIGDGEPVVLSKKSEAQEPQPDEPSTSDKDSKPLLEENGNTVDGTLA